MPRDAGRTKAKPRWLRWVIAGLLVVVFLWVGLWVFVFSRTVSDGYELYEGPRSFPASKVVKDDRPAFRFEPDQSWQIEFGRGSGWHGLDTVKLTQDGELTLFRQRLEHSVDHITSRWETTSARLPPETVAKVFEAVESNRLLELDKAYHADVSDGTHWVLRVRQGASEKVVCFDNHFPKAIVRFAERLDQVIVESVGPTLRWREVPSWNERSHERELWESIQR